MGAFNYMQELEKRCCKYPHRPRFIARQMLAKALCGLFEKCSPGNPQDNRAPADRDDLATHSNTKNEPLTTNTNTTIKEPCAPITTVEGENVTEPFAICFACDNKYAPYMGLALLSVLRSARPGERFHFYVLDNNISAENKQKLSHLQHQHSFGLTYIPLDEKIFAGCSVPRPNWTLSIFGRYLIPNLIGAEKVLYLDCDIMVRGSLRALFEEDISGYYLAGVPDYNVIYRGKLAERFGADFKKEAYVNSGVLLINNKKWRAEKIPEQLLRYSQQHAKELLWPDQDAINVVCQAHKKLLPERYNVMGYLYKPDLFLKHPRMQEIRQETNKTVIRHFHAWKKNFFVPHRSEYLYLITQSPWPELMPKDDVLPWAWCKLVMRYLWAHPFCFLLPKFYKRWKLRGTASLFID